MQDAGEQWAQWLQEQMDRRPRTRPIDLVRKGGKKPNGQPVIRADRVHHWLKGQRPSYDLVVAVANALGAPAHEALAAAGYAAEDRRSRDEGVRARTPVDVVTAIENDPDLLPEARAHLLNQYELLLRIQAAAPAALVRRQEERRHLAAVATSKDGEPADETDEPQPLAYVARTRDGKPVVSDPETEARIAREVEEAVKANPHARKRRK